jgi:hypothetical protein
MRGVPNLLPCKHGAPVALVRLDGHWVITNDCCESHIDWNRLRLARQWNARPHESARPEGREPSP